MLIKIPNYFNWRSQKRRKGVTMRLRIAALAMLAGAFMALAGSQAAAGPVTADRSVAGKLDRSTVDRPDDASGYNFHLWNIVPAGVSNSYDTDSQIGQLVDDAGKVMYDQTGMSLRIDRFKGEVDVTYLPLNASDAQIAGLDDVVSYIASQIRATGFSKPTTINLIVYDGSRLAGACGWGSAPASLAVVTTECNVLNGGAYALVHEAFHALGIAPVGAPHYTSRGHVSEPDDLMAAFGGKTIDVGRDDYWNMLVAQAEPNTGYLTRGDYAKIKVEVKGPGSVEWPDDICFDSCGVVARRGKSLELIAKPNDNARLAGWSGACAGSSTSCRVTMDGDKSVVANFAAAPKTWTLKIIIKGRGIVKGAGAPCTKTCIRSLTQARISLTVSPLKDWRFVGWSGCSSRCIVNRPTSTVTKTVTVLFKPKK